MTPLECHGPDAVWCQVCGPLSKKDALSPSETKVLLTLEAAHRNGIGELFEEEIASIYNLALAVSAAGIPSSRALDIAVGATAFASLGSAFRV